MPLVSSGDSNVVEDALSRFEAEGRGITPEEQR